jgi:hypothetical protein
MRKFVSYLRVSTDKQDRSGLGEAAQRQAVKDFINGDAELVAEFVEVETGKRDDRPKLAEAMHRAKVTGAKLVIAKLDRLSRNVAFIAKLQDAGVPFVCCDMPEATEFTIHILAAVAQHERKAISARTKAALGAINAAILEHGEWVSRSGRTLTRLGNINGAAALRRAGKGNGASVLAIKAGADRHARDVLPVIEDIRAAGITTLKGIAAELTARGILTARCGVWDATGVKRLLERV